jgi:GNAT superfamily N-acetyltransferase
MDTWNITIKYYDVAKLDIRELSEYIGLRTIAVRPALRNQGFGTLIMQELCEYADSTNKTIGLCPTMGFGATSLERLEGFYRKFGFEYIDEFTMERRPEPLVEQEE